MTRRRLSTCRWCQAPIRWVLTEKGRHLPIDPHPVTDGNLTMTVDQATGQAMVERLRYGDPVPADGLTWVAHSTTCPSRQAARARDAFRRELRGLPTAPGEQLHLPVDGS